MDEARYREAEERLWASVGAAPTERWLDLAHSDARVRVQEVGDGPPVLFVHGGSICGASWASLVAVLDGFRCIVLDRPGCGLSAPLAVGIDDVGRLATFADTLVPDVLDALSVDRARVAATSFGGYMALRSAAAHPDRFEQLLLFGFPVGAPIENTPLVMRLATVPWVSRMMLRVPPSPRMVRELLKGIGLRDALAAGRVTPEMLDWFLSMLRDTDTFRNETQSLPQLMTLVHGMNDSILLPVSLLERIRTPTFFLWGEADPFGGAATARAFVAHVPGAQLEVMPRAGHAVWMDDVDHAADVTRQFFAR